tara:strand:+ start:5886 stop:6575 length:690 start_codon:yes stop_codon:yes gene_type:complete
MKMKNSILKFIPFFFLFIFSSCDITDEMTDDELIDAIINSEKKVQILESDLPIDAKNNISSNMPDDFFDNGKLAPKLGYEVKMRTLDFFFMGDKSDDIYFDINGRELQRSRGDDKDDKGEKDDDRGDKDDKGDDKKSKKKNCFYLEYPVSIKFPDDSVVEVADRKEHSEALRTWHKENPDVKERAQFIFPINIYWIEKDTKTSYTISSHEEMREVHGKCKESKDSDRKD